MAASEPTARKEVIEEKETCACGSEGCVSTADSISQQFSIVHALLARELEKAIQNLSDEQKGTTPRKRWAGWSADKIAKLAQAQLHILEASDYISDPSDYDDDDEINLPEAYQDVQDDIDECDHVLADLEEGPVREQVKKRICLANLALIAQAMSMYSADIQFQSLEQRLSRLDPNESR